MQDNERLKKQLAFALEIDKEKNIFRQTHLSNKGRNENDAEHAWHMAIMAYLLREYSNEKVDIGRVMLMCLIHDIVEIDAGDTYAYDEEGLATQKEREDAAKERIFSLLPDDQKEELIALFDEFEDCKTAESKYAHAMDNLQPLILNDSNGGGDWRAHNVCAKQIYGRQEKTRLGSERFSPQRQAAASAAMASRISVAIASRLISPPAAPWGSGRSPVRSRYHSTASNSRWAR